MAHQENTSLLSNQDIFKNMTQGEKDQNGNYIKIWE